MTKIEAVSKVRKLRNQAKGNSSTAEAESARKIADEIIAKWNLSESDLAASSKVLAFEELLAELESYSRSKQLPPAVAEAVSMLKKEMSDVEKADALGSVASVVRIGSLFLGKQMGPVKDILEKTLRKHEVMV